MYKVYIENGNNNYLIHDFKISKNKLKSGTIVQGINSIDTFSFSILPTNIGFNQLNDYTTLVKIFNTKTKEYEFDGRVLQQEVLMTDNGLIYKNITCESCAGYLCDSEQLYVEEKNWSLLELINHLLNIHNAQVENYKKIRIGNITMTAPNDNIYIGIQRENTWNSIKNKLIEKIGGEIKIYRKSDGLLYMDYHKRIAEKEITSIELKKNMKSLNKKTDPSSFITRLIPLGAKIKKNVIDENGNSTEQETEERVGIESVNDGLNYIDDSTAISQFGIIYGYQYWDDVTQPNILLSKAEDFLENNNKVQQSYSITALDLSLINLNFNSFKVGNYYPVKNSLLGIDEYLRITKKNINIVNFTSSNFEIGDQEKTLSQIQINNEINLLAKIQNIESNYATNENVSKVIDRIEKQNSVIEQMPDEILIEVSDSFYTKLESDEQSEKLEKELKSSIKSTADSITLNLKEEIKDFTAYLNTIEDDNEIILTNTMDSAGTINYLEITGFSTLSFYPDISYPGKNVYPDIMTTYTIIFENENNYYELYVDLGISLSSEDKLILTSNEIIVERENERIKSEQLNILKTFKDITKISVKYFENVHIKCEYIMENEFTKVFATQAELNSQFSITNKEINTKVSKADVISEINQSAEKIQINADKISLKGKKIDLTSENMSIDSKNFKLDRNGYMTCSNATITGGNIELKDSGMCWDNRIKIEGSAREQKFKTTIGSNHIKLTLNDPNIDSMNIGTYLDQKSFFIADREEIESGTISIPYVNISGFRDEYGLISLYSSDSINGGFEISNDSDTVFRASGGGRVFCTSLTETSLEKNKKNIQKFNDALSVIKEIDIYKYNLKSENFDDKKHIGFVIGDDYKYSKIITSNDNLGVDLYSFISVCCKAIQEQQKQIENLNNEINKLKEREKNGL